MSSPKTRLWRVAAGDSRGMGVFATANISPGTLLMREEPRITLTVSQCYNDRLIEKALGALPQADRDFLCRLSSGAKTSPGLLDHFNMNSFDLHDESGNENGRVICEQASRLNHSCIPTTFWSFRHEGGRVFFELRACTNIPRKDELTVDYNSSDKDWPDKATRDSTLQSYGFTCGCDVCVEKDVTEPSSSESRRQRLNTFLAKVRNSARWRMGRRVEVFTEHMQEVEVELDGPREVRGEMLATYLDIRLCVAYASLASVLADDQRWEEAAKYYRKARAVKKLLFGSDDDEYEKKHQKICDKFGLEGEAMFKLEL